MKKAKIVPVKNVSRILVDIRKPNFNYERLSSHMQLNLRHIPGERIYNNGRRSFVFWGTTVFAAIFLVVLSIAAFYLTLEREKKFIKAKGEIIAANFYTAAAAIKNFEPETAVKKLEKNSAEIESLRDELNKYRSDFIAQTAGSVIPIFKEAGGVIKNIDAINSNFLDLAKTLEILKANGFKFFLEDGDKIVAMLNNTRNNIQQLIFHAKTFKNTVANLKQVSSFFNTLNENIGGIYLKQSANLHKIDKAFERLISLIGSENEKRILLFFQNPSEIRPAGGFIGSYADLAVKKGQITNLDVRDIYDPDGQFFLKIVPPEPLQGIVSNWAARDANWFFDFPTSAKTVISFLESSKIYEENGVTFDGAIALNINVIESILKIVGPLPVEEYNLTISSENFLREVQREVEAGREKIEGGYPKRILQVLTPIILEKLKDLKVEDRSKLFDIIRKHIVKKDIMFYVKDTELASFLRETGLDGSVYTLPTNFWGSYLAVVNANVAGGKSDAFVYQNIESRINIDASGNILTDLTIKREHRGNKEKDPWWRATNKNYIQVFANPSSNLLTINGNQAKKTSPSVDYSSGYEFNADLQKIEFTKKTIQGMNVWTMEAFGKTVFGTWTETPAGKTTTLTLRYQLSERENIDIAAGKIFTFIFEKQSGAKTSLKVTIAAPVGFLWAESGEPFYTYENEDPDGRIILNLTLSK